MVRQTEIIPDAFMGEPMIKVPFSTLQYNKPEMFKQLSRKFHNYVESTYGITEVKTISSIWNMWLALTKEKMKNLNLNESDDFEWIQDIDPTPLNGIKFHVHGDTWTTYTVIDKGKDIVYVTWPPDRYGDGIGVPYKREDVEEYLEDGSWIQVNNINESDDFEWIRELKPGITLQPNTLYYFDPILRGKDVIDFGNRITNNEYIKNWLINGDNYFLNRIKYFVTSDNVNDKMRGWCDETDYLEAHEGVYPYTELVNAREEFSLH